MLRRATALKRICDRQRVQNAIERKYHLSLSEYDDYMEVVLMPYANYCGRKSLQLGKELVDILAVVFAE